MKYLLVFVTLIAAAGSAVAQTSVPETGLVAEGEGRWSDALAIYYQQPDRGADTADLWLRIADIEARLTRSDRAIVALQRAASLRPGDPHILARLSQAYAAAGHAEPALHAISAALALSPDTDEYLRSAAALATWAGDYRTAAEAYGKLRQKHPQEHALLLAFARVKSWSGQSDAAATAYHEYFRFTHDSGTVAGTRPRGVLARQHRRRARGTRGVSAQIPRGSGLRSRAGADSCSRRSPPRGAARARSTARLHSRRSRAQCRPAIALAGNRQHGAAVSTLNSLRSHGKPDDIHAVGSIVRTMLGTSIGPTATFYDDSDGLRIVRVAPRADIGLHTDTRIHAGYERTELNARVGSGLETVREPAPPLSTRCGVVSRSASGRSLSADPWVSRGRLTIS